MKFYSEFEFTTNNNIFSPNNKIQNMNSPPFKVLTLSSHREEIYQMLQITRYIRSADDYYAQGYEKNQILK